MRSSSLAPIVFQAALLLAAASAPARAESGPGAVILFDASGSMWGDFASSKTSKFNSARESLKQSLGRTRPDARIGFMAFGNRRKADCKDVELLAPVEAGAAARVGAALDKISPKGKGPLAFALTEAAKTASAQRADAIILVYDGVDNCQQDACAAAAAIAKTRPGLAVHTLGLELEPGAFEKTTCVSRSTGGKAFEARDPQSLPATLESVFQQAGLTPGEPVLAPSLAPAPQPVAPEIAAASGPPRIRLTAHLGDMETPIAAPVTWIAREPGTSRTVFEKTAPDISEAMEPGTYEITAAIGRAAARATVTVAPKGVTAARIALDAGVARVKARDAQGARDVVLSIAPLGGASGMGPLASERQWIGWQAETELVLPSGRYRASATRGLARQEQEFSVEAGGLATVDIPLNSGRADLSAAEREGGDALDGVSFSVWVDDPAAPRGRREIARSLARQPSFTLPSGTYYVTARLGTAEAREQIAVGAGGTIAKTIVLPVARLSLSANLKIAAAPADAPLAYRVTRLDGEAPGETARGASLRPEFPLAPGRYRIDVTAGAHNAAASQTIDLAAGARKDLVLSIETALLDLRLGEGRPAPLDSFWEVKDEDGKSVWRTTRSEPSGFLAPGTYTVRFESRSQRLEKTIALAAGEHKTIGLGAD